MNERENLMSLIHRKGYEKVPIDYNMCPSLKVKFDEYLKHNEIDFNYTPSYRKVSDLSPAEYDRNLFRKYYDSALKDGSTISIWGVAHEPGSSAAFHMTKMLHPMEKFDSIEQIESYPFPDFSRSSPEKQVSQVKEAHEKGIAAVGSMQVTIWETSWYLRGMENLMIEMMTDDPMAETLLDRVTSIAILRAESFARSGVDILFLGDDIGMQHSVMMSDELYCTWLKPRLKRVINAAKAINPDISVFYHSCGYVTPFIPHLIEAGIDVLNPIQPECMKFSDIHNKFGERLSFHGTIGTQSTMPFGTPDDVRREVFTNLDTAGDKGGLYVCPTHLLEPEVPVENVVAYLKACRDYK